MQPEGPLPHSQQPATCPYPEPDRSSPRPHPTSLISTLILSSRARLDLPSGLLLSGFPTKTLYASRPHTCYMLCLSPWFDHPNDTGSNPVAEQSKASVCGRSLAGIAGSNPAGGMDVCLLEAFVTGRSLVQGVLPIVSLCVITLNNSPLHTQCSGRKRKKEVG